MPIQITRTKVILPRRRSDLLSRARLNDLLYELLDHKLIILAAPAGYGKTSLLVDFAHQSELPVCWYSLDSLDRDPLRFIAHWIAALSLRFPAFGQTASAALDAAAAAQKLDLPGLTSAIVNDAYENIREHWALVVDDYHLVNDQPEIDRFVSRFIQEVDENCHIILASRSLLQLTDLPLMVARSQVGGLSFEELSFTALEIQSLVLQNYQRTISYELAEELWRETEGWITGLLMSAQSVWQAMPDRLRTARVSGVSLYDYLAQQVLDQQPPEVRRFLLQTSLLEEFDLALCSEVLGEVESTAQLFAAVQHDNLFILPVGEDGTWIRYHHLFRDFLQKRLGIEDPAGLVRLQRRLAGVYAGRGEWEKADALYRGLNDWEAAAGLMEAIGATLLRHGRLAALAERIDGLPAESLQRHPALLSLRGVVDVMHGQPQRGLLLLDRAEGIQRAAGDAAGLACTLARRAIAHRFLGSATQCLADAGEALKLASDSTDSALLAVRAEALRAMTPVLWGSGQVDQAIRSIQQALQVYPSLDDRPNIAQAQMELGFMLMGAGQYRRALECFDVARQYWQQANSLLRLSTTLNNLGVLYYLTGDLLQANGVLNEALTYARQASSQRQETYALLSLGDLYADLDAPDAALEQYARAAELARGLDDPYLQGYAAQAIAGQHITRRDLAAARQALQVLATLPLKEKLLQGLQAVQAARLNAAEDCWPAAAVGLEQAAACLEAGDQTAEAARACLLLAGVHLAQGDRDAARTALQAAFRLASGLDSPFILATTARRERRLLDAAVSWPEVGPHAASLLEQAAGLDEQIPAVRKRLRAAAREAPFVPPSLAISALGRVAVERDGQPVTAAEWQNQRKVRELFFFLLAHPRSLTKEAIGLVFWPDSSPAQLKLQFKNAAYRLRSALGSEILLFIDDRYEFNTTLDYHYDVEAFEASLAEAARPGPVAAKIAALRRAVALYTGPYLPEAEGSWVVAERERLHERWVQAHLDLAQLHLESGDFAASLEFSQRVLSEDPCQEEAHRLAMRAHAARKNRTALVRQWERCRTALKNELGVEPSPETETLYRILTRKK